MFKFLFGSRKKKERKDPVEERFEELEANIKDLTNKAKSEGMTLVEYGHKHNLKDLGAKCEEFAKLRIELKK